MANILYILQAIVVMQQGQPEQQEQAGLTPELVKDLVQLLGNNSTQVRHGTISAILQYTPTSEARLMFKDTALMSYLRKYLFEDKLSKICLSTLIHFAAESELISEYFKLTQPLILKMKEWKGLQLQLSLLLLLNMTKQEQCVAVIIGNEDKQGYLVEVLYALLEHQAKLRWIVVAVFVDISSFERGRKFLVEDMVAVRFVQYLTAFDQKLRQATLRIVRNCAFEWENQPFTDQLLKEEHKLFAQLVKLLPFLIYKKALIHDLTHTKLILNKVFAEGELSQWESKFQSADKNKALAELEVGIDIMLILSNAQLKQRKMGVNDQVFKDLLSILKFTDIKEQTKDKLEALQIFGL